MSDHLPNPDGSSPKRQKFDGAPEMIIDPDKTYNATMVTSKGTMELLLDHLGAPVTVNSFVYLARWHYYDGIVFHRIIPGFVCKVATPRAVAPVVRAIASTTNYPSRSLRDWFVGHGQLRTQHQWLSVLVISDRTACACRRCTRTLAKS